MSYLSRTRKSDLCYQKRNTILWSVAILTVLNIGCVRADDAGLFYHEHDSKIYTLQNPCVTNFLSTPSQHNSTRATNLWLRSAQFYSFCLTKYGMSINAENNGSHYACNNGTQCNECLKVCTISRAANVSTCESECGNGNSSSPCRVGCRSLGFIFGQNVTNTFGINSSSAALEFQNAPITNQTDPGSISIDYLMESHSQVAGTFYVLQAKTTAANAVFTPIYATTKSNVKVTVKKLCDQLIPPSPGSTQELVYTFQIIPVNVNGWSQLNHIPFSTGFSNGYVTNLTNVGLPFYSGKAGETPQINFNLVWSNPKELESIIKKYEIFSEKSNKNSGQCVFGGSSTSQYVNNLATTAVVQIAIPEVKYKKCTFDITVKPIFDCLTSTPQILSVYYEGCWILQNYENWTDCVNPAHTTIAPTDQPITNYKVESINNGCDNYQQSSCNNGTHNATCSSCKKEYWNITVLWTRPALGSNLKEYTCWLGYKDPQYPSYIFPYSEHVGDGVQYKWTLSKDETSLTFKVLDKYEYHFKVFPVTEKNREHDGWPGYTSEIIVHIPEPIRPPSTPSTDTPFQAKIRYKIELTLDNVTLNGSVVDTSDVQTRQDLDNSTSQLYQNLKKEIEPWLREIVLSSQPEAENVTVSRFRVGSLIVDSVIDFKPTFTGNETSLKNNLALVLQNTTSLKPTLVAVTVNVSFTDYDECSADFCDLNANCSNHPGTYNCSCHFGYQGNGSSCTKVPTTLSSTTKSTTSTKKDTAQHPAPADNSKVGLSVGLGIALFLLFVVLLIFILFQRRRKARKKFRIDKEKLEVKDWKDDEHEKLSATRTLVTFDPPDQWEVLPSNMEVGEVLGEGAFGKVYIASVKGACFTYSKERLSSTSKMHNGISSPQNEATKNFTMKAAVKMMQPGSEEQQRKEFLDEIKLMKDVGQHKHIVSMLGCVTISEPLCLIFEYMPHGDLLHYLRERRFKVFKEPACNSSASTIPVYVNQTKVDVTRDGSVFINTNTESNEETGESGYIDDPEDGRISPEDLLKFTWQISSGMEYLARKGFVHRDLAARNILVGHKKICKISDFGLTRWVYEEKMYMGKHSRKLPLKWMSIEAIYDQVFTTFSDVWAFGVVIFEIVTLGGTPYPTINNRDLLCLLRNGYRMEKPENCSANIYEIMQACWIDDPLQRPTFPDLRNRLEYLIKEETPYVDIEVDESNPCYQEPSFRSIESDSMEIVIEGNDEPVAMRCSVGKDEKGDWLSAIAPDKVTDMDDLDKLVNKKDHRYSPPKMLTKNDEDEVGIEMEPSNVLDRYVNTKQMVSRPIDTSL